MGLQRSIKIKKIGAVRLEQLSDSLEKQVGPLLNAFRFSDGVLTPPQVAQLFISAFK